MQCLIVDDHPLTRDGTAFALRADNATIEVFEAESLAQARRILGEQPRIGLVLLDLDLGDSQGVETLEALKTCADERAVDARIVVLSGHSDLGLVLDVINRCATGFILKATSKQIFQKAISLTLAGGIYIPAEVLGQLALQERSADRGVGAPRPLLLTPRETEVAAFLIRGFTYKRIARELEKFDGQQISEHTVRSHLGRIAWKLGVTENAKAGVMAEIARRGLVFPVPGRT